MNHSSKIAISSPGFKKVLPTGFNYIVSHNLPGSFFYEGAHRMTRTSPFKKSNILISTIGAIRDFDANMELVKSLANDDEITIKFFGKGSENIKKLSENIKNVECHGYYNKDEESELVVNSDFLNIYYPEIISHSTALSNRFYNALIFRRPMIVRAKSIQGDLVEKYNLGLSVANCENLKFKIHEYVRSFDFQHFSNQCAFLLEEFSKDYGSFKNEFTEFLYAKC